MNPKVMDWRNEKGMPEIEKIKRCFRELVK